MANIGETMMTNVNNEVIIFTFNGTEWKDIDGNVYKPENEVIDEGFEKCEDCDGTGYIPLPGSQIPSQMCRKCWGTGQLTWLEKIFGKEPPPRSGIFGTSGASGYSGISGMSGHVGASGYSEISGVMHPHTHFNQIPSVSFVSPIYPNQMNSGNGPPSVTLDEKENEIKKDVESIFNKLKNVLSSSKKVLKGVMNDNGIVSKFLF